MIFIAVPYYHTNSQIIADRVAYTSKYCGALLKNDVMCMAPVVFGTTVLNHCDLPNDFSFWDKLSFSYLEKCTEMHVLMLNGWDKSRGVKAEIEMANNLNIPIKYIPMSEVLTIIHENQL